MAQHGLVLPAIFELLVQIQDNLVEVLLSHAIKRLALLELFGQTLLDFQGKLGKIHLASLINGLVASQNQLAQMGHVLGLAGLEDFDT